MQIKSSDPNHPGGALPLMETLGSMALVVLGAHHALAPCPWSHRGTWALGQRSALWE